MTPPPLSSQPADSSLSDSSAPVDATTTRLIAPPAAHTASSQQEGREFSADAASLCDPPTIREPLIPLVDPQKIIEMRPISTPSSVRTAAKTQRVPESSAAAHAASTAAAPAPAGAGAGAGASAEATEEVADRPGTASSTGTGTGTATVYSTSAASHSGSTKTAPPGQHKDNGDANTNTDTDADTTPISLPPAIHVSSHASAAASGGIAAASQQHHDLTEDEADHLPELPELAHTRSAQRSHHHSRRRDLFTRIRRAHSRPGSLSAAARWRSQSRIASHSRWAAGHARMRKLGPAAKVKRFWRRHVAINIAPEELRDNLGKPRVFSLLLPAEWAGVP